jgi:hypothetical protein
LKRRYSEVCIANRSKMTQLATAASPIVWLTSKHSIRCTDCAAQRLLQGGEALVLRGLLREPLPDRELGVLHRHRHPYATLAAGIGHELDLVSRLRRQHFGEHRVVASSGATIVGGVGRSR